MEYLEQVMDKKDSSLDLSSYRLDKKSNRITPFRKRSYDITSTVQTMQLKDGKSVLFIGISGGQASGKKKYPNIFIIK
jgi:hypothetical protein